MPKKKIMNDPQRFCGDYELPYLDPYQGKIPLDLVPFSQRKKEKNKKEKFVHFYENDPVFAAVVKNPSRYLNSFNKFAGIIGLDLSVYNDFPKYLQIANLGKNRETERYFLDRGIPVIPNVRWSDTDSFGYCFDGIPPYGTICVSTLGCLLETRDKQSFKTGFDKCIEVLRPQVVLVHGKMPDEIFAEYANEIEFRQYDARIQRVYEGG